MVEPIKLFACVCRALLFGTPPLLSLVVWSGRRVLGAWCRALSNLNGAVMRSKGAAVNMNALMPNDIVIDFSSGASLTNMSTLTLNLVRILSTGAAIMLLPLARAQNSSSKKWWLWLLLAAAVGVLGWMVWSSLGSIDKAKQESP